jgi:hypothetical protein
MHFNTTHEAKGLRGNYYLHRAHFEAEPIGTVPAFGRSGLKYRRSNGLFRGGVNGVRPILADRSRR